MPWYPRGTREDRFWSKVDKSGDCWLWTARKVGEYGAFERTTAHRVAWELTFGAIPDDLHVLHRCDNPPCCRPLHLFLGTPLDNHADQRTKGRLPIGEATSASKLTEEQVISIRGRYVYKQNATELAREFGISRGTLWDIVAGNTWSHLPSNHTTGRPKGECRNGHITEVGERCMRCHRDQERIRRARKKVLHG